jgi:ketopantoate hydroxymethyltransferase
MQVQHPAALIRLQDLRVAAMERYVSDVHGGDYPAPQHLVDCEPDVINAFRDWLDRPL